MKLAIVDDLQSDIDQLSSMLSAYGKQQGQETVITEFLSGEDFLEAAKPGEFSVVFLDILMGGLDGLETARRFRETDPSALIVFVTTEAGYAVDGYDVEAAAFLVKPPQPQRLARVMKRLERRLATDVMIPFKTYTTACEIPAGALLYAEIRGHSLKLHTDGLVYSPYLTLQELRALLPEDGRFLECYRGVLINLDRVKRIEDTAVVMENGDNLPVSRRKRQELVNAYAARRFAKMRGGF